MMHDVSEAPAAQPHPDEIVPRHDCPIGGRSGFVIVEDDRQVHYLEWGRSDAPMNAARSRPNSSSTAGSESASTSRPHASVARESLSP